MSEHKIPQRPSTGPHIEQVPSGGAPEHTGEPVEAPNRRASPVAPKESPPLPQQGEGAGPLHRRHV